MVAFLNLFLYQKIYIISNLLGSLYSLLIKFTYSRIKVLNLSTFWRNIFKIKITPFVLGFK